MKKHLTKIITLLLLLSLAVSYSALGLGVVADFVTEIAESGVVTTVVDVNEYVVFDLSQGSISIKSDGYSGYVINASETDEELTNPTATYVSKQAYTQNTKFYVMQSSAKSSVSLKGSTLTMTSVDLPDIINEKDVKAAMNSWDSAATAAGRTPTANYATVESAGKTVNLTIDDIWSTNQYGGGSGGTTSNYNGYNGGLNIHVNKSNTFVSRSLKGDNRLAYLYYCNYASYASAGMTVKNGESGSRVGSLTVIGDPTVSKSPYGSSNYNNKVSKNNWNSVIGGTDNNEACYNLKFDGGVVYAGAHDTENCTAIGAGGNGRGVVTINGGTVTAVSHSTGTAIGGGIAHTGTGGIGEVTINGGNVYAYNFGINAHDRITPTSYGSATSAVIAAARHIPGTAIGGASSILQAGAEGIVTINGGNVYAESLGGAGIGGGNSINSRGGVATVKINGGMIDAISKSGTVTFNKDGSSVYVPAGTSIGGGSSKATASSNTGGTATVTITGGNTLATGIGGGGSMNTAGGGCQVKMSGGTVVSTGIGGGFSETLGYTQGKVTVTGGSLNSSMSAIPTNGTDTLYLTRISFFKDNETKSNVILEEDSIIFKNLSTTYGQYDIHTDDVGMIYLWLPSGSAVISAKLSDNTAVNYTADNEADADIDSNDIGSLLHKTELPRYIVGIAGSNLYSLYSDEEITSNFSGAVVIPQGIFEYYVKVEPGYTLTQYIGTIDRDGNGILTPGTPLALVDSVNNVYKASITVDRDSKIWYVITGPDNSLKFVIDLTGGDATVTETGGKLTIEQSGYRITDFVGSLTLTTSGYPTSNALTIKSVDENGNVSDGTVDVSAGAVNIISKDSAIVVESGKLNIDFDDHDNIIHSTNAPTVSVGENGSFILSVDGIDSLKLSTDGEHPIIEGAGAFVFNNDGGFVEFNTTSDAQVSVGTYEFSGKNKNLSTELYEGDYSYDLVGFRQGDSLYSKSVNPTQTNVSFSARGVHTVYNAVNVSYSVSDNVLSLVIKTDDTSNTVGLLRIIDKSGNEVAYTIEGSIGAPTGSAPGTSVVTVTVADAGNVFRSGNITVYAGAYGSIPYTVKDSYSTVFDNQSHGISVSVDESITRVTYTYTDEAGVTHTNTTVAPSWTNVKTDASGNVLAHTVTFTVSYIGTDSEVVYPSITDSRTVTITPATNEWTSTISCQNVISGKGVVPSPTAASKFGASSDVKYYYYADREKTQPITDISAACNVSATTEYFVQAVVEKTANYGELLSDVISFKVIKADCFGASGKYLDRDELKNYAQTDAIMTVETGSLSVYFETLSVAGNAVHFSGTALPKDTKITLVIYSAEGAVMNYGYYVLPSTTTAPIALSSFIEMGTNQPCPLPQTAQPLNCLFTVEYENLPASAFNVILNNDESLTQSFRAPADYEERFETMETTLIKATDTLDGLEVTVKPNAVSMEDKILAFTVNNALGNSDTLLNGVDATLVQAGTTIRIQPQYSSGNLLVYSIGTSATTVTGEYTLTLRNLDSGSYDITSHIRNVRISATDPDYCHVLEGSRSGINTVSLDGFAHTKEKELDLFASEASGARLVKVGQSMSFAISTTVSVSDKLPLTITLKEKAADGTYRSVVGIDTVTLTSLLGNYTFTVPSLLKDATYRIEFSFGGRVFNYNIIIVE